MRARRYVRPSSLDIGGLGDQSFNDSAYAGLQRAKKDLDVQTETLESQAATDYVNNLTQLADSGYDPDLRRRVPHDGRGE